MNEFWNYIFIAATAVSSIGMIFIIYSRSASSITSRLFIITLVLVIAYLISHTVHFIIMPSHNVTLFDKSCHSLLLTILISLTFLTFNFPVPQQNNTLLGLLILIPSVVILILLWKGILISESYAHGTHFTAEFTSYYIIYIVWYVTLIIASTLSIILKYKKQNDPNTRKQLLLFLFGLIITNSTTFIFGILLPWILGFYYLVEISPLAFLVGLIFFSSIAIGKYNMFPAAIEKVHSFSLNKKIFFSALVFIPIIILLVQIPISRALFNINSHEELVSLFLHSIFTGLIVSLALSFIISKIIAQPIIILKEKVSQIEKGNYDINVNLKSSDEIGELAQAINSMADTLNKNKSELLKREERISILLNAFEKSLAAIAVVDNDFNIIEANSQFYTLIESPEEKKGFQRINELQFYRNQDLFLQIISEVNEKDVYTGEIKIEDAKRTKRDLLISVTKIVSQKQKGYLFVEIDITDKKRLEAEIAQSEKLAALGKMSAILAHEIKTPLTSIKMNIDILNQTLNLSSDEKDSFEIIKKETSRLAQLVKEVLQFSRTSELYISKFSLNQLIEETFQLIKPNIRNKQIKLLNKTNYVELKADLDKFKQVLLNLIQNSIDAIDTEGTIEITSKAKEQYIFIYVKDNGNGINEPEKIFEPFYTTKISGTGLGLAVAQKIIEQHKGTLRLISTKKGETVFEIKLPFNN